MGLLVATAFLFVACSSGSASAEDDADMFDAEGNPIDKTLTAKAPSADSAPDFELVLFENANHRAGEVMRLSQFQGQPVVVNFWFPSCPPCVAEMPDLDAAFQNHAGDGMELIGVQLVGLDTAADGQEFVDMIGVSYALGADEDGTIFKDYKVTGFPTTVFLDRDHNIVRKWAGLLNGEKLEELIQEALE